jgi:hypothetical protein
MIKTELSLLELLGGVGATAVVAAVTVGLGCVVAVGFGATIVTCLAFVWPTSSTPLCALALTTKLPAAAVEGMGSVAVNEPSGPEVACVLVTGWASQSAHDPT